MQPKELADLEDIRKAIQELRSYTSGLSLAEYLADGRTRRAVERCLEIAGEALIRIRPSNESFLNDLPGASKSIELRNIIAHEYGDVDDSIVWKSLRNTYPHLWMI
ncbi:MAG: HepT-like ribonuclease domain-containing protein [Janthinobacterium lividum]